MSEGTVQPSTLIFTNDSGDNFWSVEGEMKDIGQRMTQMRLEQQLEIIISCCTLHNFIILHNKRISISAREPNLERLPNVQLYNDRNNVAMGKLRAEIVAMLSSNAV